jgi:23S rRNA (uracil1939-C5)-methyltransferase
VYRRDRAATAPAAIESYCPIKGACGACKHVNLDYQTGLREKYQVGLDVLGGLTQTARLVPPIASPKPFEYRSLFKLAVRPSTAEGRRFAIGLFRPGTHDVLDLDPCPLHVAPLRKLIADLRTELEASTIQPWNEESGEGHLRYVAARAAHLTGEVMITFVVAKPIKAELRQLVSALQRRYHKLNSAHMNVNDAPGNAIFGPKTERLAGGDGLRERLIDLDFEVGPTSFFQVNPWLAINLYRRIEQIAGPVEPPRAPGKIPHDLGSFRRPIAWDLYCGTGQISLVLARQGYKTLGIEENPEAVQHARLNAQRNRLNERAEFIAGRVEDVYSQMPNWANAPSLIVVNPSRRGLAESTRRSLAQMLANNPDARLVYVSCDVTTLARDLADLKARTTHQVRQIEAFDMFAQTEDLEWLAVMSR